MEERWVCRRCFAANNESDAACRQCGLQRDAELPPEEQAAAMQEHGATRAAAPWWRRLLRFWWIPAIGLFLAVGYFTQARRDDSGQINTGGTLSIGDLQTGDCFDAEDTDELADVQARPCTQSHQYELFHVATWTHGGGDYPSGAAVEQFVIDQCGPAYDAYVGTGAAADELEVLFITPTQESWDDGDRVIQCAVYDDARPELTESLRAQ